MGSRELLCTIWRLDVGGPSHADTKKNTTIGFHSWQNLSLRSKFFALSFAVVVGFDLAFVLLWQPRANQFIVDLQSSEVQNELATAGEGMVPFLIQNQVAAIHETLDIIKGRHENWITLKFDDPEGNRIYPISPPTDLGSQDQVEIAQKVIFRGVHAATISAVVDFSVQQAELRKYGYSMIAFATVIFVLAMLVLALAFEVLIGRRAAGIAKATKSMAEGDFSTALPKASGDEIGRLVQGFAEMREQVFRTQESLSTAREDAEAAAHAKSQFLAVMSHEIRTPLNGLLGTLQLLEATDLSRKQKKMTSVMNTSGQLLLHHVNDVLDLYRLDAVAEENDNQRFDLVALVSEVMESMRSVADSQGNELFLVTEDLPEVSWGEPVRVKQVLFNLLSNANKFTKDGKIEIEVIQSKNEPFCSISVTDTGIGIAKRDLGRVFLDFEQIDTSQISTAGGTGLGLGISKRLVELMGGRISVESTPGMGSTFCFSWKSEGPTDTEVAMFEAALGSQVETNTSPLESHCLDVLTVEDNQINRFVIREMLENEGHRVSEASNGREAVKKAASHRYDLVFMDISMPEIDGIEATKAIRSSGEGSFDRPIIALTAHAFPEDIDVFKAVGMNDVLLKPISRDLLMEVLRSVSMKTEKNEGSEDSMETANLSLLDVGRLEEMSAAIGAGKTAKLAKSFILQADIGIKDLTSTRLAQEDLATVAASSHRLAGSAATFGAAKLRSILADIEGFAKQGDAHSYFANLRKLDEVWGDTRELLHAHYDWSSQKDFD